MWININGDHESIASKVLKRAAQTHPGLSTQSLTELSKPSTTPQQLYGLDCDQAIGGLLCGAVVLALSIVCLIMFVNQLTSFRSYTVVDQEGFLLDYTFFRLFLLSRYVCTPSVCCRFFFFKGRSMRLGIMTTQIGESLLYCIAVVVLVSAMVRTVNNLHKTTVSALSWELDSTILLVTLVRKCIFRSPISADFFPNLLHDVLV